MQTLSAVWDIEISSETLSICYVLNNLNYSLGESLDTSNTIYGTKTPDCECSGPITARLWGSCPLHLCALCLSVEPQSSLALWVCSCVHSVSLSLSVSLSHGLRASVRWESLLAPELGPFRHHGRHSRRQHVGGKLRHGEVRFTCFTFKLLQWPKTIFKSHLKMFQRWSDTPG